MIWYPILMVVLWWTILETYISRCEKQRELQKTRYLRKDGKWLK